MTYTINGKEWTEDEINLRCAELLGINVSESVMQLGISFIPTGRGLIDENFMQYDPCNNWGDAGPIIEKCWVELMAIYDEFYCLTKWESIIATYKCTKLVAACICFIEVNL